MAVVKDQDKKIENKIGKIVEKIHHQFYSKNKMTHMIIKIYVVAQ